MTMDGTLTLPAIVVWLILILAASIWAYQSIRIMFLKRRIAKIQREAEG